MKKLFSLIAAVLFAGSMMAATITITAASGFKSAYGSGDTFTVDEAEFWYSGVMYNGKGTPASAAAPKTMSGVSSITAGQAFGQKNTSLGVWIAQMYLDPLSALGAAAYIIWQNLFNSVQLFVVAHKK